MINIESFNLLFKKSIDRYVTIGISLIVLGLSFALFSYILLISTPLTALGLSSTVVGIVVVFGTDFVSSPEEMRMSIENSCAGMEVQLLRFTVKGKAVYRPSEEGVSVLVPIERKPELFTQQGYSSSRVVLEADGKPMLAMTHPASKLTNLDSLGEGTDLQEEVSYVLVDILESVRSLYMMNYSDKITVQMFGIKKSETEHPICREALGSLQTYVIGFLLAYLLERPVFFIEEIVSGNEISAVFEVH